MASKKAKNEETQSILEYFAELPDPRRDNQNKRHELIDIIAISILATICGAEHFTEMEEWGEANEEWLRSFLKLPNGIPSHDTFGHVFARLDSTEFKKCFATWVESIRTATAGEVIPIDGKTMRRSGNKGEGAVHIVSAWASRNRLTLGQVKVDEKSNEITAIPELLQLLYLKGCIVTIDAMGTQKEIAKLVCEKEADYVLALKDNQPNLRAEVEGIFEAELAQRKKEESSKKPRSTAAADFIETIDNNHGRRETRRVYSLQAPEFLLNKEAWQGLKSLIMVEAIREVSGQVSTERRYYIASLAPNAELAANAVRTHWTIENSLHWVLDLAFREDDLRVRAGNAPENLALIRKLTHNLLQQEKTLKRGIKTKRRKAGWDRSYLLKILNITPSNP
ncbi:MAG: ISAs1 family transposase [Blastocatellia bacterium]|nr:ISAs1 family transposase [Blastocatellia bacterium]